MTYQKSADLKDSAKGHLTGKYYNTVLTCLLYSTVTFLLSQSAVTLTNSLERSLYRLTGLVSEHPAITVLSYLLLLLASAACSVFRVGLALFFLNTVCQRNAVSHDLFYGFRQQFGKAFRISLVMVLLRSFCTLPLEIGLYLYGRQKTLDSQTLLYLAIAMVLGLLIYFPPALALSQSYYLMLDFPEKDARSVLKLSARIMKGHKKRLFYIEASFLPLTLLSLLSFGIGSLWLMPYKNTTYALFFLDLMKPEPPTHSSTLNTRS